jgi:hypothetical protein
MANDPQSVSFVANHGDALIGLGGVLLGFLLGEGTRLIVHCYQLRGKRLALLAELRSNGLQIPLKRDILAQVRSALQNHEILPARSVPFCHIAYDTYFPELYADLDEGKRNCIRFIHERLKVADGFLDDFFDKFTALSESGALMDAVGSFLTMCKDVDTALCQTGDLIQSCLGGRPIDVMQLGKVENKK